MNHKHIALLIVGLLAFLFVQLTMWVRGSRDKMNTQAQNKDAEVVGALASLDIERNQLRSLEKSSESLITFLNAWQPHFERFTSPQSIEVELSMRVREANLVSLAQRFEPIPLKGDSALPNGLRAYATFEDTYVGLINWLGKLEKEIPTLRVSNLRLTKGTRPGDLRMELAVEQPMLRK